MDAVASVPISVAIVEDDAPLRSSLAGILQRAPQCRLVGAFASAEEAAAVKGKPLTFTLVSNEGASDTVRTEE